MTLIKMVQTSKNRWRIESEKGIILLDDIILSNDKEALDFIKCYVSTWQSWEYTIETTNQSSKDK